MTETGKPHFITNPSHLQSLESQRFVVARIGGESESLYKSLQEEFLRLLTASRSIVSYPNVPHVTIRGFPEGTDLQTLRQIVREWARATSPLQIKLNQLSHFPSPYKIVILEVEKNAALVHAYDRLADATASLPRFEPRRTSDEWTFHVSILYGKDIGSAEWQNLVERLKDYRVPPLESIVSTIELVSFDGGQETDEEFRLG